MYERNELLQRLYDIYHLIAGIEQGMNEFCALEYQIRSAKDKIDTKSIKGKARLSKDSMIVVVVVFGVLVSLSRLDFSRIFYNELLFLGGYFIFRKRRPKFAGVVFWALVLTEIYNTVIVLSLKEVVPTIILIIAIIVSIGLVFYFLKFHTSYVEAYNKDVAKGNAPVIQRRYDIAAEAVQMDAQLCQVIEGWYPPDYLNDHAVSFFINALENGKADTMKELVNLYDNYRFQNQVIQGIQATKESLDRIIYNQEYMKGQLHFNNVLGVCTYYKISKVIR